MTTMVERVARAIAWADLAGKRAKGIISDYPMHWTNFEDEARAAIDAMREPDEAVLEALENVEHPNNHAAFYYDLWRAGIDAALAPAAGVEG